MSKNKKEIVKTKGDSKLQNKHRNLTQEEIAARESIFKVMRENKAAGIVDFRSLFDLIYFGFITYLEDRKLVERDLKQLHDMLHSCPERMIEIMEKSKGILSDSSK